MYIVYNQLVIKYERGPEKSFTYFAASLQKYFRSDEDGIVSGLTSFQPFLTTLNTTTR